MSHQIFTLQELKRAWRELRAASEHAPRKNAHRLLLFYSIECGLKAVWLKQECRSLFTSADISKTGHDLNDVIKSLHIGYDLPENMAMSDVKDDRKNTISRKNIRASDLHQVWRYGGALLHPPIDDANMEAILEKMQVWIETELL